MAAYLEVLSKSFVMPKVRDKTIYHGMRLLSGYYRIIHTWSHLCTHPLQFGLPLLLAQLDTNLVVRNHLQSSGKIKTRQRLVGLGMEDAITMLKTVQKGFDRWENVTYIAIVG